MRPEFIRLTYDTKEYPFHDWLASKVFKVKQLDKLHVNYQKENGSRKLNYKDNLLLRKKMQDLPDDSVFYLIYRKWVLNILGKHYKNKISFTAHPKMRVHLAGTGPVSGFHRDIEVTKSLEQINCYLPFTDVCGENTLWCQIDYNHKVFEPLNLKYGEALLWDGGLLLHGTHANTTELTRVSCDFRFSPISPELLFPPWSEILSGRPK